MTAVISPEIMPFTTIFAAVITVVILTLTVIVLIRLPKSIGQKAANLNKAAVNATLPVFTHHKKITIRERKRLSFRLVLSFKFTAIILPIILLSLTDTAALLPLRVVWSIALFCAVCSLVYVVVQYIVAIIGKIDRSKIW